MKKKWIPITLLSVVVLFIGAVIALSVWFESPGIRVFGGDLHAEVSAVGYIIDGETEEILGQTPVNVDGSTSRTEEDVFDGELLVLGYQNTATGTISATKAIEYAQDFCIIHHLESCTHPEENEEGITQDVEHFCDYYYTWYLYPEDQDFLVVAVQDFEEDSTIYVVCADSEKQALERYDWFLANCPE